MSRDELEANVWRLLGMLKRDALSDKGFVESVCNLAIDFAAGDSPAATSARRAVLAREADGGQ